VGRIRTAVIGAGKIADVHASVLASLPDSELVAICGRTPERAEALAARYHVKAFTSVAEMVEAARIEAVVVCTPHPAHALPAVEAMERGVHALVEKPLAASLSDADAMIAAAQRAGVKLGVISQRRWYPPSQRVRQAIDAGKIGKPALGMATLLGWRDPAYYASDAWRGKWESEGGGVLVNQAPHQLDMLLWYMGEVEELFGYWANLNHPYIEVEDTAIAVLKFKNGGLGNLTLSNSQKPGLYGRVHIHGDSGASVGVQTDGGSMFIAGMTSVQEPPINDLWTVPGEEADLARWQDEDRAFFASLDIIQHYFTLQIQDFLAAIREDRPPLVTGEEGRRVVELFTALYRSQALGQPVRFPLPSYAPA
jgi:UDP-N-acetyl-2-amino-2-deoxyglucuronate dehydrogenase